MNDIFLNIPYYSAVILSNTATNIFESPYTQNLRARSFKYLAEIKIGADSCNGAFTIQFELNLMIL